MHVAVCFTNFGPYHLARLRALGHALDRLGGRLSAIEVARRERRYPWQVSSVSEPFDWVTLFPNEELEAIGADACTRAIVEWLDGARPDALGIVGYSRPECLASLHWARQRRRPAILMSESQAIDKPRVWWKEAIKSRRVRQCSSALVGGPRHRDYLIALGMPAEKIVLGYNAVDNARIAELAQAARNMPPSDLPSRPYFLAVNRFVPEKNLSELLSAYALYRKANDPLTTWDLVLCGDGTCRPSLKRQAHQLQLDNCVHFPGFLQEASLVPWYAHASAFVHPSRLEPWGLVVNEAAICELPLLVSDRCGCVETLVPDPGGTTGYRFQPGDLRSLADALSQLAQTNAEERRHMGRRAREIVDQWGPERFASGTLEAIELALGQLSLRLFGSDTGSPQVIPAQAGNLRDSGEHGCRPRKRTV